MRLVDGDGRSAVEDRRGAALVERSDNGGDPRERRARRPSAPSLAKIVLASMIGTTIEFYDFYIYATAAVLVFPRLFFPAGDPARPLQSLATFALAFFARPVGSVLFGHFGDRVGRKRRWLRRCRPWDCRRYLSACCPATRRGRPRALGCWRCAGQVGPGGEWGGAVLLATENARPAARLVWHVSTTRRAVGFFLANGLFLLLALPLGLDEKSFTAWAWRIPFLLSAVLVAIGLYLRVSITETPAFPAASWSMTGARAPAPFLEVLTDESRSSWSRVRCRSWSATRCSTFRASSRSATA